MDAGRRDFGLLPQQVIVLENLFSGRDRVDLMKLLFRQFMVFSVVGAVGTAFHFAILASVVNLHLAGPVAGSMLGFTAGAVVNYLLNYHLTFNSRDRHLSTFLKFLAVAVSGLCLNTLIMYLMTQSLHYLVSQVVATAIVLAWNFLCNRFWTFREACLAGQ